MAENPRNPDWSLLHPDLLHLIAQTHLPNPADVIRLRCVCRRWRSAVSLADLPSPRLPWLLLPYSPDSPSLSFLNPLDLKTYSLPLPDSRPKTVFGSPHGLLIVVTNPSREAHPFEVSLFNPITKTLIDFPPLPPTAAKPPSIRKAILSPDPFLVAVLLHSTLAFCVLGRDDAWSMVDVGSSYGGQELAYCNRRLYLASCTGLKTFSIDDPSNTANYQYRLQLKHNAYLSVHLMDSCGDILVLLDYESGMRFDVYRVDFSKNLLVRGVIRDQVFFVSRRQSLCLPAEGMVGLGENCGLSVSEEFLLEAPPVVHLLRAKDGCSFERAELFWRSPCMTWADWRDMMKMTWFLPKLY